MVLVFHQWGCEAAAAVCRCVSDQRISLAQIASRCITLTMLPLFESQGC
jgi:hypothetical protein